MEEPGAVAGPVRMTQRSSHLFPRAVASIALVVIAQLWASHHLGIGGDTPWVAVVVAAIYGGVDLLERLDPAGLKRSMRWVRKTIVRVLTMQLLVVLYAIFVVVTLVVSSVLIISESASDQSEKTLDVTLTSADTRVVDQDQLGPRRKLAQFVVLTNPFGRPFRLLVDGYLEQALMVYPIVGTTVTLERDLRVAPSLLLRPPLSALGFLEGGGYLTLTWKLRGRSGPLIAREQGYRGSFLIGRPQAIPDAKVIRWKLELEGGGFAPKLISQTLLEWNSPKVLSPTVPLTPGMIVAAAIHSRADIPVARAEITVSSESLIDVGMLPVEE